LNNAILVPWFSAKGFKMNRLVVLLILGWGGFNLGNPEPGSFYQENDRSAYDIMYHDNALRTNDGYKATVYEPSVDSTRKEARAEKQRKRAEIRKMIREELNKRNKRNTKQISQPEKKRPNKINKAIENKRKNTARNQSSKRQHNKTPHRKK
jgi:hypothetical protein